MSLSVGDQQLIARLRSASLSVEDLGSMSKWIEGNTAHPKDSDKPWSFKDHEFQIQIVDDPANVLGVMKCSQVGVSELMARWAFAYLCKFHRTTAIYTLPTTGQVRKFSPGRLDPIIEGSPYLQTMIDEGVNNSELKKIGDSFLYIAGTFTQKGAISVPARVLVNDEVDFSDPVTMTSFLSRLGHEADGGIRRLFSTPTVEGVGISKFMATSSRARYGVKHKACGKWVFPIFLRDVEIPGFEDHIDQFTKEDLADPRYRPKESLIRCPGCGAEITPENFADVEARQWVAESPDAEEHGHYVAPQDCPAFKATPKVIHKLSEYRRFADWVNFDVGDVYEDAENSFLEKAIDASPRSQIGHRVQGCIMGVDVGKMSNIVVGKPAGRRRIDVVHLERFKASASDTLLDRITQLHEEFGVIKGVIDAGPDLATPPGYVEWAEMGEAYACYYSRGMKVTSLSHIHVNDAEGIVTAARTESIDRLAKLVNSSSIGFPISAEMKTVKDHLRAMKRVKSYNAHGDEVINWQNTGPDHYAHALNYMNIAYDLLDDKFAGEQATPVLPMMGKVGIKQVEGVNLMGKKRRAYAH